ncbi:hypothetical protein [Clostridioides difficile]|uniref:hypothetical protein n=1 Tax=Clostridioides difficile TaxID=1496 RepID=UPI002A92003F|nr:hypothetical protein [Clostridioides difficile]MDY6497999.1 hypothetical protein [Clostridioides difficile]
MGRPKNKDNRHLPPRMTARPMKSGVIHYYYGAPGGKKIPLGTDLAAAKIKWAQLSTGGLILPDDQFNVIADQYEREYIPTKAPKTQAQ